MNPVLLAGGALGSKTNAPLRRQGSFHWSPGILFVGASITVIAEENSRAEKKAENGHFTSTQKHPEWKESAESCINISEQSIIYMCKRQ